MPLVSIVTPVYNAARWLPETMASVRAQTLTDWEHILVDDGSSDNSVAIIAAAAADDPRVRLLQTPCNNGPSAARNMALDAARGRFIAFLDADDLWLPEKLSQSVWWMTAHGYEFIYHDYRHISQDGCKVGRLVRGPGRVEYARPAYAARYRMPDGGYRQRANFWISLSRNHSLSRRGFLLVVQPDPPGAHRPSPAPRSGPLSTAAAEPLGKQA